MKSVLIADDSRVSRKMIRNLLSHAGFEVVGEAINAREGLDLYVKLSPDIVVMDITIPEMNGMDSLREIREHDPKAKVVIISAEGDDNKKEAMDAGAIAFITKPYADQDILDAVGKC